MQYINLNLKTRKERSEDTMLTKSKVALVRCTNYQIKEVKKSLNKGMELLGGIEKVFGPKRRVLLKPNLLAGEAPEKHVTTHPAVFCALAETLLSEGFEVGYGDSPGFGKPEIVARKAGYESLAKKLGIPLEDFVNAEEINFLEGKQVKHFQIAKGITEYDTIVSLAKWKTHGLTVITGAVKNQLGCVPGLRKSEFHFRFPDVEVFSKMLTDLNLLLRPSLYIIDAVVAMEGNGPRNGRGKALNLLAMSTDPVALDATMCRVIDLDPSIVPTCKKGEEFGLGTYRKEKIEIVGNNLEEVKVKNFEVKKTRKSHLQSTKILRGLLLDYPSLVPELCKKCGICHSVCPARPKAINMRKGLPEFNLKNCLRCFCCQEMCPTGALILKEPLPRKIIRGFLPH